MWLNNKVLKHNIYKHQVLSNATVLFSLTDTSSVAEQMQVCCILSDKLLLRQMLGILHLIDASFDHFMVHFRLIRTYSLYASNVRFFIISSRSRHILSTSRSLELRDKN